MIVTFDTGVLVRATPASNGPARRLVEHISDNPVNTLITSEFILGEVGKVLCYPRMERMLGLSSDDVYEFLDDLRRRFKIIDPQIGLPGVLTDPNDDAIVYTAVASRSDVLCAVDRDLHAPNVVAFCKSSGIEVVTDLELLQLLR